MVATDAKIQDLMLSVYRKKMGVWEQKMGELINKVLKDTHQSVMFKSVVLEQFLRGIDPSKEQLRLQQFFTKFFTLPDQKNRGTYM